jgi:hypothetical protein
MKKTKTLLLFCLITALLFSPLSGMDDHGANVVVTKKDGTLTQGELIAVKWNALVVSAGETSPEESVSIAIKDIGKVEVVKKSKIWKGMLWGALIGAGIGVVGGSIAKSGNAYMPYVAGDIGLLFSVIGFSIGALVGASADAGNTFHFENLSKEDRDLALFHLSDYAAIKGVR